MRPHPTLKFCNSLEECTSQLPHESLSIRLGVLVCGGGCGCGGAPSRIKIAGAGALGSALRAGEGTSKCGIWGIVNKRVSVGRLNCKAGARQLAAWDSGLEGGT